MKNNRKMILEFKNQTAMSTDMYLYGEIISEKDPDWDPDSAVSISEFKEAIDSLTPGATLNIFINSPGGDVFAASTMITMLKRAREKGIKIVTYIDGLAASAASLFPMIADESHIYSNSMLMIHKPMTLVFFAMFNEDDALKLAEELERIESAVLIPAYKNKSKISTEEIKKMLSDETWLNADDILSTFDGFTLHEDEKSVAACASEMYSKYKHTPSALLTPSKPQIDSGRFDDKFKSISERTKLYEY